MSNYQGKSAEELRLEDYKSPPAAASSNNFPASCGTSFSNNIFTSQTPVQNPTSVFTGSSNPFSPAASTGFQSSSSPFGTTPSTANLPQAQTANLFQARTSAFSQQSAASPFAPASTQIGSTGFSFQSTFPSSTNQQSTTTPFGAAQSAFSASPLQTQPQPFSFSTSPAFSTSTKPNLFDTSALPKPQSAVSPWSSNPTPQSSQFSFNFQPTQTQTQTQTQPAFQMPATNNPFLFTAQSTSNPSAFSLQTPSVQPQTSASTSNAAQEAPAAEEQTQTSAIVEKLNQIKSWKNERAGRNASTTKDDSKTSDSRLIKETQSTRRLVSNNYPADLGFRSPSFRSTVNQMTVNSAKQRNEAPLSTTTLHRNNSRANSDAVYARTTSNRRLVLSDEDYDGSHWKLMLDLPTGPDLVI
jgi:hypothetical protein